MNDLKKPTSLFAGTNIIFSIGSFMYLYKKMEELQNENAEMKKNLQTLTTKLHKLHNDDSQRSDLLKDLNKDVKHVKEDINKIESFNMEEFNAIAKALSNEGIEVKLPKKKKGKKHYKHYSSSSSDSSSSEYNEPPRRSRKKAKEESESENEELINMLRKKKNG